MLNIVYNFVEIKNSWIFFSRHCWYRYNI